MLFSSKGSGISGYFVDIGFCVWDNSISQLCLQCSFMCMKWLYFMCYCSKG